MEGAAGDGLDRHLGLLQTGNHRQPPSRGDDHHKGSKTQHPPVSPVSVPIVIQSVSTPARRSIVSDLCRLVFS